MDGLFRFWLRTHWLIQHFKIKWWRVPHTCFSTVTYLKSAPTAVHVDGGNAKAGLSCLTTLGNYTGGDLLFPQSGIMVPVQPGDLLIGAFHQNYHCNLKPLVGERYSVIGYFREKLPTEDETLAAMVPEKLKSRWQSWHGVTRAR
jgi:hypothetical protein